MAKVISVKPKIVSLGELRDRAVHQATLSRIPPHIQTNMAGELGGIVLPLEVRVRTAEGIYTTNYFFAARANTIEITLSDGYKFRGTETHKMLEDRATDSWRTLHQMQVGSAIETASGVSLRVTDKKVIGVEAVGDVCVPGPHSYLLENGAISHNSLVANQLSKNVSEFGYHVVVVPLEMTKNEMTGRLTANIARLDVTRVLQKRLATGEKALAYKRMTRWMKKVKAAGGRLTYYEPEEDLSIEEIFAAVSSYDCDMVIIDYISLLKGADGDDAWSKLGSIARSAKMNAKSTNRVNVLLCQVNQDGAIRYARSISEHSTNSFIWVTPKAEREKDVGRVRVEQPKSRNSRSFPFDLGLEWATMRVVDVETQSEVGEVSEPSGDKKPKTRKNLADV